MPATKKARVESKHPFIHIGAGLSAARKNWTIAMVLREAIDAGVRARLDDLERPEAFDMLEAKVRRRVIVAGHESDSLQWVVAARYAGGGPRADREATDKQWRAFNRDVDAFLLRVHAVAPILAVVRTVDDEYSTELSSWHEWSCGQLPRVLPKLAAALDDKDEGFWIEHVCDLWRAWLAELSPAEQKRTIASVPNDAGAVFQKHGGAPKATPPPKKHDDPPSLDEQKAVWTRVASGGGDVLVEFARAFAQLRLEDEDPWNLSRFVGALSEAPSPEDDALIVDIVRAALRAPSVEWPNTHWRPDLLDALVRLRRFDEATAEAALVAMAAESYLSGSWCALIRYLDAVGDRDDADALFRAAKRYVTHFEMDTKRKPVAKAGRDQNANASRVVLKLTAPARADLDRIDDALLSQAAFLFANMVEDGAADGVLVEESKRMRAALKARGERRLGEGQARLARGERCDEATMLELVKEAQGSATKSTAAQLETLTRAALPFPALIPQLEALAYYAKERPDLALAVYRPLLASPVPDAGIDEGKPRKSWLQSANSALVVSHAAKLYDESAKLADALREHARENPYITHSAACSYAAVMRYDDALEMAKLAVELRYPHLDRLRVDEDLGPLLTQKAFKALFS